MKKKVIIEDEILFVDEKFFGDCKEHAYECHCHDGKADCFLVDDEDETAPKRIVVKYPMLKELSNKMKDEILEYRGLYDLTYKDIHYGDIMVVYGEIEKSINQ